MPTMAGCGPGRYSISLAKKGYSVTDFDITPSLLEIANEQVEKAGVDDRIQFHLGSIEDLSLIF